MHEKRLAAGLYPDPMGSLQRSPDAVAILKGRDKRKGMKKYRGRV